MMKIVGQIEQIGGFSSKKEWKCLNPYSSNKKLVNCTTL